MSGAPTTPLSHFQVPNLFDVSQLTCVITGGSSGLGLYAAHALALNGALVYILGRRKEQLDATVARFHRLVPDSAARRDADLIAVQADITSKESLSMARQVITSDLATRDNHGIQLLICNAGIGGRLLESYGRPAEPCKQDKQDKQKEFLDIVDELWSFSETEISSILNTNVTGTYLSALTFLPLLRQGSTPAYASQTIVISSNAAWAKLPILNPIYNISKTAVSQLGQMLSTMFADHALRTNIIEPGLYPSHLTSSEPSNHITGHATLSHTNGADIPLGRCGNPNEHAASVLYLASRNTAFANGCTIRVDGGALQKLPASD